MLHVYFGAMSEAVFNTAVYFKNAYENSWIIDPLAKEMIRDIDKSEVLGNGVIESPVLGLISPIGISGGVKTLILMQNERNKIFNASTCGNNCAKWILKLSKYEDLTINLRHIMDFGNMNFDIHILNTDTIVHSMDELVSIAGMYV